MPAIPPGKWRGLKSAANANHVFEILAFDQRGSYRRMLPDGATYNDAVNIKCEVVATLAPHTSGVLLDPIYGFAPAATVPGSTGLLMALEKSGYTGDSTYRQMAFIDGWSVGKIKAMGAAGVKLLVYYHPQSETSAEIEQLVAQIVGECRVYDIPLFLEPVSYSLAADVAKDSAAFAATRPDVVRETAQRLGALGPDILKLEFPVDAAHNNNHDEWRAACEAVSAASPVPWVLLSAGVDFPIFEQQVRVACEAGASGFLAGRAIWKECVAMTPQERQQFLTTTATERVNTLKALVEHARPWTDFYSPMESSADWFVSYHPA